MRRRIKTEFKARTTISKTTISRTRTRTTQAGKRRRLFLLALYLLLAASLAACSYDAEQGPHGEAKRTDSYTFNGERREITKRMTKEQEIFKEAPPEGYHLAAAVDVNRESGAEEITYEIMLNEVHIPMLNVIQSFTLDPEILQVVHAGELFTSNVSNTYETTLGPGKEPLGLSLSRSYVMKPESEISPEYLQNYTEMYVKISYGPEEQRTEDYFRLQAKPSSRMVEYMKIWGEKE
ncbi:hypothetical protein [Paenibacillus sp. AN1007]|uniref:DUF5643 domain-containing protein n=1 Tax=Paenibacillus sp. AN1007 TaxID=3151385 RepID=A0AAU8ND83_9BACL